MLSKGCYYCWYWLIKCIKTKSWYVYIIHLELHLFPINHSGICMHMKNSSTYIFVRHYLFSPQQYLVLRELCVPPPPRALEAGRDLRQRGRGNVATPIQDISAPKLAAIRRGKKMSAEVEEGEWGRKRKCPQASHWTGARLASEDLRLAQWLSIDASRSPVVSGKPHRGHSGVGTRGRPSGWLRSGLALESSTTFTEVSRSISCGKCVLLLPKCLKQEG